MSSGHREPQAASSGAVVRMIQREPGLQNFLNRPQIVSRKFLVPYGAGRSMDGDMTYVDENVPERFRTVPIEVDKYVNGHEGFEWWLMTRKNMAYWLGPGPQSAHWWATGFEHMLLRLNGWSDEQIAAYENEWLSYVSADESQRISPDTVPPDLFTGAYEAGEDSDAAEQKLDDPILQTLMAARARLVPVREVGLV